MGGDIRLDDAGFDIGIRDSWKAALAESVEAAGGTPYPIPAGASDHPLGGLGFANWAEVAAQEAELGVFFDHVVVCTVTGSTHAGMIAGFALEERDDRTVVGIDASKTSSRPRPGDPHRQRHGRADRARSSAARRRDHRRRRLRRPAYGIPDDRPIEAIHLAARTEGMLTDPVYEGKSMAGLIGMVRAARSPPARGSSTPTSAASPPSRPTRTRRSRGAAGPEWMERETGLEPATSCLGSRHSTG